MTNEISALSLVESFLDEYYLFRRNVLSGKTEYFTLSKNEVFFLGLEMASVPMACLVAFDKFRHNSAEAGAKFILTATFSSGVMIYGISLLYAACGTLYFGILMLSVEC